MNLRAQAANVISKVLAGHSLTEVLAASMTSLADVRDQALLQAICYGVCRWYFRLIFILNQLLEKPLKSKDADIMALLLVGLYQLSDMRIPAYAALSETVAAVQAFKKSWAKNLVNGVLRHFQRNSEDLLSSAQENLVARFSHPAWMIEKIQQDWPACWETILQDNNQHPPFALRVNQQIMTRDHYLQQLLEKNISAICLPETAAGLYLDHPLNVTELPGFQQGAVSVQDGAAQLAATLLQVAAGHRVLDACAAPGGKTSHLLELAPTAEVVAIDHDESRLHTLQDNLQRLRVSAICQAADVGDTDAWWDGKLFDRILLDAPCSASGVIRRHPDIKLLRRSSDILALSAEQMRLLQAVWPLLKTNGILLYATCSIFTAENVDVMSAFLANTPNAAEEKITAAWGIPQAVGRQILPGMHNMDGFYYACLRKF